MTNLRCCWWRTKTCHVSVLSWGEQAWSPVQQQTRGLTQNIMLNPKMKYLMQQLTSWALKCFPDIIWMDFFLNTARSGKESHLWSSYVFWQPGCGNTLFFFLFFFPFSFFPRQISRQLFRRLIINIILCFPLTKRRRWSRRGADRPTPSVNVTLCSRYGSQQGFNEGNESTQVNQIKADGLSIWPII